MASTLISKIAGASIKVGALATDKRNAQQGYDYISADKVLERAGDALAAAGVVIVPSIVSEVTEAVKTDKGGTRYDSIVHFGMVITDGETQLEMPWCGRGSDYAVPDKAMYKAITSGHKYFLTKLLNIGVGNEDGEHDDDAEAAQATAKPASHNAPKTTHKATSAPKAASEQNDTLKSESPPHQRLWGIGLAVMGQDWDMARPWILRQWSKLVTPDNIRSSATELSEDEKTQLGDYLNENASNVQRAWPKQKGQMVQATSNGKATA